MVTDPSPELATQTAPAPAAIAVGRWPTWSVAFTSLVFGSIRETVSSARFATQTQCLSKAMSDGFAPTGISIGELNGSRRKRAFESPVRAQTEWKPTPTEIGLPAVGTGGRACWSSTRSIA